MAIRQNTRDRLHVPCARCAAIAFSLGVLAAAPPAAGQDEPFGPVPPGSGGERTHVAASAVAGGIATPDATARSGEEVSSGVFDPETLPLGGGANASGGGADGDGGGGMSAFGGGWGQTIGALALVIGLIVALRWGVRRFAAGADGVAAQMGPGGRAPSGLLTVLARYPVGRGQTLVLLQVDTRVLLLCQSGEGFRTLSEIREPEEVASLLTKARDESGDSMVSRFRSLLKMSESDPGLVGHEVVDVSSRTTARRPLAGGSQGGDAVSSLRRRLASLREVEQ